MSRGVLLVAGPLVLDDLPQGTEIIGGGGAYAAIAAAPIAPVQLWARAGADLGSQRRGILAEHRIDLAGLGLEGASPRWSPAGFIAGGPLLPDATPTSAEDLGAVLLVHLPPDEQARALEAVRALPGSETRPLLIAPRPASADAASLRSASAAADVLVIPSATALRAFPEAVDALTAAELLRAAGAKCVALTNGVFGGLLLYQQKATTWPALPVATVDPTGTGAAFAGALAASCASHRVADFRTLKRGCAQASAVAGLCAAGVGPKKLLAADERVYLDRFNRLRRTAKF